MKIAALSLIIACMCTSFARGLEPTEKKTNVVILFIDDPTDEPRRNLYAVRWKDWRLIKGPEGWRLFDLRKDPQETKDLAASQPEVVANMRQHYDAFVATLPPIKPSADYKGGGQVPKGWGWEIGDGK